MPDVVFALLIVVGFAVLVTVGTRLGSRWVDRMLRADLAAIAPDKPIVIQRKRDE